jgi:hypothetical protein
MAVAMGSARLADRQHAEPYPRFACKLGLHRTGEINDSMEVEACRRRLFLEAGFDVLT